MNRASSSGSSASPTGCTSNDRKFLFELLVPADRGAARVGRRRQRPLRRRAAPRADAPRDRGDPGLRHRGRHLEDRGRRRARPTRRCSPRRRARARAARASSACCSAAARATRRSTSGCAQAAPVEGFVGFAIGRSIWWDALKGFLDGVARRARTPRQQIADNYLRFIRVYEEAASAVACRTRGVRRAVCAGRRATRELSRGGRTGRPVVYVGRAVAPSPWLLVVVVLAARVAWSARAATARSAAARGRGGAQLRGRVVRVIDGDTIRVALGGRAERVRYIGIDTPEAVKPGHAGAVLRARGAAAENARLVAGRRGAPGARRRARATATAACSPTSTAAATACSSTRELVRGGFARTLTIPPNVRYAARFPRSRAQARRAGRGLWGACRSA